MADPTVQLRLSIEGENRAGAAIRQAEAQADSLGKRMSAVADRSGDVERGFIGIKDIASALGPEAQRIADVAGGLEGLGKGLGALFGPVGIAIGLAAGAAALLYQHIEDGEEKAAQAAVDRIDALKETPVLLAKELGLRTDVLQRAREQVSAEQARTQHAQLLQQAGDALKALKEAEKAQDDELIAKAEVKLAKAKKQVDAMASQLRIAQRLALVEAQRGAEQARRDVERAAEDAEIARISDTRGRITAETDATLQRLADAERRLHAQRKAQSDAEATATQRMRTGTVEQRRLAAESLRQTTEATKTIEIDVIAQQSKLSELRRQSDAEDEQRQQRRSQRAQAQTAARQRAEQARAKAEQDSDRVSKEIADQLLERGARYVRQLQKEIEWQNAKDAAFAKSQQDLRDATIEAEADPAKRAELEYLERRRQLMQQLVAVQLDTTREARTAAAEQGAIQLRLAALDARRVEAAKQRAQEERDAKVDAAFGVAGAVVQAMGVTNAAEKAQAAFRSGLAVAEGLYAVTQKGIAGVPQLLTGLASAAQFALASGQSAPSVPAAASAFGGGTGGGQTPRSLAPVGMGGGGPVTINVTGAVIGTPQQVGMQVQKAAKSLKGTGYGAKAGA